MWTAVALLGLTLVPAQDDTLKLTNPRPTYGVLGQKRESNKYLPGDVLVVAFDIEGLKVKDDGTVQYAMGMELTKQGNTKSLYKTDPQPLEAKNTLGGSKLPAFALSIIGTDTEKGNYTLTVTVKDRAANKSEVLKHSFEVTDSELGFVRARLTSSTGEPVPNIAVPGQRLMLNCSLVGFKTNKSDKLPDVMFEMQVLDDAGKPTVAKPFKGPIKTEIKDTPGMMNFLPMPLELNRAGNFKIQMKATCNLSGKTTNEYLDLKVQKY